MNAVADKLEALEKRMRIYAPLTQEEAGEVLAWADRLAAIRAELGEVGQCFEVLDSEPGDFNSGQAGWSSIGVCLPTGTKLYTTPPATVPVEALRGLAEKWRAEAATGRAAADREGIRTETSITVHAIVDSMLQLADELTALIAAQEEGK